MVGIRYPEHGYWRLTHSRAQMGCGLIDHSALFRSVIQACEDALRELPDGPRWSIVEELSKAKEQSNVNDARYSQPLCTALQIGIVSLLKSWGIRPAAVVGHSSGEICAAFAAELISLRTAMVVAYYRGKILGSSPDSVSHTECPGSMCAVGLSEEDCKNMLKDYRDRVQLAAINSPCSCTLSGESGAIKEIAEICADKGQYCRLLKVDKGREVFVIYFLLRADPISSVPFASYAAACGALSKAPRTSCSFAIQ